jgi:polyribonucleotide nucleotidyltransferase
MRRRSERSPRTGRGELEAEERSICLRSSSVSNLYGKEYVLETGELAKQAGGAVVVRQGDTMVLVTATASRNPKDLDFFPLTVDFEERMYAAGKLPGGFIKREARPSEKAILTARMIDRPLRSAFADGFRNEVQIIATVLSADQVTSRTSSASWAPRLR